MKKTQWQFTHRPDNQADIKRILREARQDGLTLVEVKGGPDALRGVYLDALTIETNAKYWPAPRNEEENIDLVDLCARTHSTDGWKGPWRYYAAAAKRAHEQFCKNLEAAQAQPKREYPPTVSVRAAGPELESQQTNPQLAIYAEAFRAVSAPAPYVPKVGDKFTAKAVSPNALVQITGNPHGDVLTCVYDSGGWLAVDFPDKKGYNITKKWYEFKKVEEQKPAEPYIPQSGDKFTAAPKPEFHDKALWRIVNTPHLEVIRCRGGKGVTRAIQFPDGEQTWITVEFYEFKKVEEPYIPKVGDKFTASERNPGDRIALNDVAQNPHKQVFRCLGPSPNISGKMVVERVGSGYEQSLTISAYEFRKVQS